MGTFVCPYIHLYIPGTSREDISLSVCQASLCLRCCMTVGLSYQLINIIVGHRQCPVRLACIPSVLWVMILVPCLCLLGLEANWCVLRQHAVETISYCRDKLSWFIFLCSIFIISKATATTIAPPVMVVCASASSLTVAVTMPLPWWGYQWHQVSMMWFCHHLDTEEHKGCCLPHHCVAEATSVPYSFSGIFQLCHGSSTGKFLFQSWAFHRFVDVCYGVCFSLSGAILDAIFTNGAQPLQPFGAYPWQIYVHPGDGHWPSQGMHQVAAPSPALSRGEPSASHSSVLLLFQHYGQA